MTTGTTADWNPTTWRSKPIVQVPAYADQALLDAVEEDLRSWPPLVIADEVRSLRKRLAAVHASREQPRQDKT